MTKGKGLRTTKGKGLGMTGGKRLGMTGGKGLRTTKGRGLRTTEGKGLRMIKRNGIEITQPAACVDAQSQRQLRHLRIWIWFGIRTLASELCPGPVC